MNFEKGFIHIMKFRKLTALLFLPVLLLSGCSVIDTLSGATEETEETSQNTEVKAGEAVLTAIKDENGAAVTVTFYYDQSTGLVTGGSIMAELPYALDSTGTISKENLENNEAANIVIDTFAQSTGINSDTFGLELKDDKAVISSGRIDIAQIETLLGMQENTKLDIDSVKENLQEKGFSFS
jgi:uncharacterized protein YceK